LPPVTPFEIRGQITIDPSSLFGSLVQQTRLTSIPINLPSLSILPAIRPTPFMGLHEAGEMLGGDFAALEPLFVDAGNWLSWMRIPVGPRTVRHAPCWEAESLIVTKSSLVLLDCF
jgi:hypothetical protein